MHVVLGLDISTRCTGYCVLSSGEHNLKLLKADYIDLSKIKSMYSKAKHVSSVLDSLIEEYKVTETVIEENLQSFRPGMSSAKTILSLAKFNGIVSFLVEEKMKKAVSAVSVVSARSKLGIKIDRKSTKSTKEQVLDWVQRQDTFIDYSWPTKTLRNGPRRGLTVADPASFDVADSAVVALFFIKNVLRC